ncbi:MAG: hypothetical protein JWP89_1925 [Schlesneria sp.]|nr:hypothetical protein [Schlesneria sp.]
MTASLIGIAISIAVSMIVSLLTSICLSRESAARYAGALGIAAGFLAAYAYLEPRNWVPTLHWQWLPWLVACAAIMGPIAIASGVGTIERFVVVTLFALAAAWFLVPTRASFAPMRMTYVINFTLGVAVFWNLLDRLLTRPKSAAAVFSALAATAASGSALVAFAFSIRIGFLGAAGATGLAGGVLAFLWKRDAAIIRGLIGPACILLAGELLTAEINDAINPPTIALIAMAPLMLWLFEAGPLAKLKGIAAWSARAALVALPLAAAWGLSWSGIHVGDSW